jgi:hypothetical protein
MSKQWAQQTEFPQSNGPSCEGMVRHSLFFSGMICSGAVHDCDHKYHTKVVRNMTFEKHIQKNYVENFNCCSLTHTPGKQQLEISEFV